MECKTEHCRRKCIFPLCHTISWVVPSWQLVVESRACSNDVVAQNVQGSVHVPWDIVWKPWTTVASQLWWLWKFGVTCSKFRLAVDWKLLHTSKSCVQKSGNASHGKGLVKPSPFWCAASTSWKRGEFFELISVALIFSNLYKGWRMRSVVVNNEKPLLMDGSRSGSYDVVLFWIQCM